MDKVTTTEAALIGKCSTGYIRQLVCREVLTPIGKIGQTYIFQKAAIVKHFANSGGKKKGGKK
jgi:hypothetical protein